jgi:hypothetical protein
MLVFVVRILEGMFVLGAAGCVLVLVLTAIDDIRVLFGRDDDKLRDATKLVGTTGGSTQRSTQITPVD